MDSHSKSVNRKYQVNIIFYKSLDKSGPPDQRAGVHYIIK